MSVVRVPIKLRNHLDRSRPPPQWGEEIECEAIVDFDADGLALPANLVLRLKLRHLDTVRIYTLDEGEYQYRVCGIAELEVRGRTYHVNVRELPPDAEPLLGAAMFKGVDWHVSPPASGPVSPPKSQRSPSGPKIDTPGLFPVKCSSLCRADGRLAGQHGRLRSCPALAGYAVPSTKTPTPCSGYVSSPPQPLLRTHSTWAASGLVLSRGCADAELSSRLFLGGHVNYFALRWRETDT